MTIVLGVVILVAAVILVTVGVLNNNGGTHVLTTDSFSVFGYHVSGSTGTLFLYGVALGAIAMFGLALILAGARRTARRGRRARQDLDRSEQRATSLGHDRDDLIVRHAGEATPHSAPAGRWHLRKRPHHSPG
ncbi:hypothetical protein [Gordonia liuliyuniae]|uniref:Lipopolysaccharide assembly protein A domain-containing protein n=1 Tax=Gordonia liuliyuniae TaxID=2911517 RepID=A0ABS9IY53_9ACTN|nr:hypothetical protein [Gordonia liuliyuniae]MCF8590509.1 hypothetical protein [Gordonia liuliyuniae]